jgi:histidine triad (HIT) family protein
MEDCLFCKIIKGDIPNYTVYQDEKTLALLDINPNTRGHTLVIPIEHASNIIGMEDSNVDAVFRTVRKVVRGLEAALKPDGFNLVVNHGEAAGQLIHHFHCHIIPRYVGDTIEFNAKGITLSEDEFNDLAQKVSNQITI